MWERAIDGIIIVLGLLLILAMAAAILGLLVWTTYKSPWFMIKVAVVMAVVGIILRIPRIWKWLRG